MPILAHSFRSAFKSLLKEKWVNILSILTVASSLLIISLTALAILNIEILANKLPERFSLIVYLKEGSQAEQIKSVINLIQKKEETADVKLITKEEALKELKAMLKDKNNILDGLDENPLLSSLEVRIKKDFVSTALVKKMADDIAKISLVDSVYYGEKIAEAIFLIKHSVQNMGLIIFLTISVGVIFVTHSTVKILFYRKKRETEIIKLLGATRSFIRMPFLIEGGFIGLVGGGIGVSGALLFYFGLTYRLSSIIPLLKTLVFPWELLAVIPLAGFILGITGSFIALGRLRY